MHLKGCETRKKAPGLLKAFQDMERGTRGLGESYKERDISIVFWGGAKPAFQSAPDTAGLRASECVIVSTELKQPAERSVMSDEVVQIRSLFFRQFPEPQTAVPDSIRAKRKFL